MTASLRGIFFRVIHTPAAPGVLLALAGLAVGLFIFRDFGLTWDEPLFYRYAEAVPYAYSIRDWLGGNFQLEKAFGPTDHRIYGPAYILLAQGLRGLLGLIFQIDSYDLWRLVNFLTFQAGVLLLYDLCRRWMSTWAAFGAALLFATQPLLWGHAFINPKDIPFMVFFIAAISSGLRLVDSLCLPSLVKPEAIPFGLEERWGTIRRKLGWLALGLGILAALTYVLGGAGRALIDEMVRSAYQADPVSALGRFFSQIAPNAASIPVEAYIGKATVWFGRLQGAIWLVCIPLILLGLAVTILPGVTLRLLRKIHIGPFGPLPSIPRLRGTQPPIKDIWLPLSLAGAALGFLIAIRVVGPLAGLLIGGVFLLRFERRHLYGMGMYGMIALLTAYLAWPYLWQNPVGRFIEVFRHMSSNPKPIPVLFNGEVFSSLALPLSYLPVQLGLTLTEPVWLLFLGGLFIAVMRAWGRRLDWRSMCAVLGWFALPFVYVLLLRPPMYDGYRHFLFILPPVFIVAGLAMDVLFGWLRRGWAKALLLAGLASFGLVGLVSTHPYQYTYYNSYTGGLSGAYRRFDTDYWLTCYKEILPLVNRGEAPGATLFVMRQPANASLYADPSIQVEPFDRDLDETFPGSLLLLPTRANTDLTNHPEADVIYQVGKGGAVFCVVKRIP